MGAPPTIIRLGNNTTAVASVEQLLQDRDALLDDLYTQLLITQNRMRQAADGKRHNVTFEVGDIVFLKLQPYRQQSLARRPCDKLAARFYGPFEILEKVGPVAYKLQLPPSRKINPVFHISQLKRVYGSVFISTPIPPQLNSVLELETEPEDLLDVRYQQTDSSTVTEVLIKWRGLPATEATWELFHNIASHFPTLGQGATLWGGYCNEYSREFSHTYYLQKEGKSW